MVSCSVLQADCINILKTVGQGTVDLIYLDPPFFTQKVHQQTSRDGKRTFNFSDVWGSNNEYADYIFQRLIKLRRALKSTGSVFFHCDKSASHIVRLLLDSVFGAENFQSEIIWSYKRWSNSKKGLLPAHQTIFFYSMTSEFKFNRIMQEYSPSTNLDQIMQKRTRDSRGKSVYARCEQGAAVTGGAKKGVPLSDVWEIPYLNPKAKERVGYPTQKPTLLLKRIIELVTDEGDLVLDPFCGSGTTLIAASEAKRDSVGFDISDKAVVLTKERLANPIVTTSALLQKGKESYIQHSSQAAEILSSVDYQPIHRNKGIDALLSEEMNGRPVFVRVQRSGEALSETIKALVKATENKGACEKVVVQIQQNELSFLQVERADLHIVPSLNYLFSRIPDMASG